MATRGLLMERAMRHGAVRLYQNSSVPTNVKTQWQIARRTLVQRGATTPQRSIFQGPIVKHRALHHGTHDACLRPLSWSRRSLTNNTRRRWYCMTRSRCAKGGKATDKEPVAAHTFKDDLLLFGTHLSRLCAAFGIAYVVTEYGIELTACEGPSMFPTIQPHGELLLIDRVTPWWYGLQGGTVGEERAQLARKKQLAHEDAVYRDKLAAVSTQFEKKHAQNRQRLQLRQQKQQQKQQKQHAEQQQGKQKLSAGHAEKAEKVAQADNSDKNHTETDRAASAGEANNNNEEQEIEEESDDGDDDNEEDDDDGDDDDNLVDDVDRAESLRMMEDYAFRSTWHEPRIPANAYPKEGWWERFCDRQSSGIQVGDVVVLQHPQRAGTICKRVMGLPGDTVTKPGRRFRRSKFASPLRRFGHMNGEIVPDGHIWIEGDNPWNSSDSRNYGAVPASLIVGRALLRVWPLRGDALMERGDRPLHHKSDANGGSELPEMVFSGSLVLPAGYQDEIIVDSFDEWERVRPRSTADADTEEES